MDISALINKLILLFFTLAVGFIAAKCGVLNQNSNKMLSSLVVNVTNPLQILASVMVSERLLTNLQVLELTGINAACYVALILVGWLLARLLRAPEQDRRVYQFMLVFSNVGFLGYPLAEALLGVSAKFCITISVLCFQLVCWTYGAHLMEGGERFRFSWRFLLRPCVFSSLLAYGIYLSGLSLPPIAAQAANYVGNLTSPIAMLIIGVSLAQISARTIFGNWRIYVLCIVKLMLLPLAVWAALRGIVTSPLMLSTVVLAQCMPVATNTTILCYQFGRDEQVGSSGVFLSTMIALASIPAMMSLLF